MLLALAALTALPQLVPARWMSNDPATLELVRPTPINCLLIERSQWSRAFNQEAAKRNLATFAVIRPQPDDAAAAQSVFNLGFDGVVLEGTFEPARRSSLERLFGARKLPVVELTLRADMNLDGSAPVIGTWQGLWPGIRVEEDGTAKAAPSGAAWIDTNTGFLRFVRASTPSAMWIANTPPTGQSFPPERYMQVIGDAAMTGARWVVSLDDAFARRLLARDPKTVDAWQHIGKVLEYYEAHPDWRGAEPFARLALVEDAASGALLSGGIVDMMATRHTPVRPIPRERLDAGSLAASNMAVNVDPESLSPAQREALKTFTRSGGTLLTGPPGWKFPTPQADQITLEKGDLQKLDDIWKELNSLTGRKNLGARLFNVSSMLSNLSEIPARDEVLVHLVNYSNFSVENVTVHVLGTYKSASLYRPDGPPIPLAGYEVEDGTGYDIDRIAAVATIVLKK